MEERGFVIDGHPQVLNPLHAFHPHRGSQLFWFLWLFSLIILRGWPWWLAFPLAGIGLWGTIVLYVPFHHCPLCSFQPTKKAHRAVIKRC